MTTDIAIQNPGEEDVELPATSTVVIGVNKILPGAAEEHHETEEGGNSREFNTIEIRTGGLNRQSGRYSASPHFFIN